MTGLPVMTTPIKGFPSFASSWISSDWQSGTLKSDRSIFSPLVISFEPLNAAPFLSKVVSNSRMLEPPNVTMTTSASSAISFASSNNSLRPEVIPHPLACVNTILSFWYCCNPSHKVEHRSLILNGV